MTFLSFGPSPGADVWAPEAVEGLEEHNGDLYVFFPYPLRRDVGFGMCCEMARRHGRGVASLLTGEFPDRHQYVIRIYGWVDLSPGTKTSD